MPEGNIYQPFPDGDTMGRSLSNVTAQTTLLEGIIKSVTKAILAQAKSDAKSEALSAVANKMIILQSEVAASAAKALIGENGLIGTNGLVDLNAVNTWVGSIVSGAVSELTSSSGAVSELTAGSTETTATDPITNADSSLGSTIELTNVTVNLDATAYGK